jgi:hypothetical protein
MLLLIFCVEDCTKFTTDSCVTCSWISVNDNHNERVINSQFIINQESLFYASFCVMEPRHTSVI